MTTTAPLRRPRKDAAANRAGILRAAATTLAVDPSASIDQIARAAGLSRRALYGHFDDRQALLTELISAGAQRFNAIASSLDEPHPPLALARLTAALWAEASHVQVAAALALDETHLEQTATALAPLRRALVAVVRAGQDDESLRADMAAPTLARLIEETARAAVSRIDASSPIAASLAVRAVLSIAGLSWRESEALLNAHPDVLEAN
ncbi:TetR family transcriptional regulator [Microbacterium hominis]|uniref:TetR family transcriptional regulator n=1 Tax=Microbacterium hominis TaxID=162426 RepID=A0A2K9DIX0_9MICO|nr:MULTISPECIES: TetR family transcriptional regulator [Microbacterium]AUG30959.1 TetR family transcriptional regulator [Microbacterium hominis]QOC26718.1 TetR family transcriptional regulator [Microbacterium hominis]QOC27895.1 TetR family transcriptional regulator [Microbacterium hominis]QRY39589.1 TetR family transcriptional regulator [Microbacterium hominis]QYF96954.1 TetR/AcrR family transcriptional regulator [Microbacterium sp. PAMC21962]